MKTFSSKKSRNLFLAAALVVGSLVFNAANAATQTPDPIVALDSPNYQSGVEKYTVSGAPVGSTIQVYGLQGQSLKAQAVTSNVEILKTATLPQSVYVVVVNDKNQEILRQKVIL